ncbi:hypothetical protein [Flavobacterium sp. N1718]|uniref:hypothetical protein n=1 Tax=Flavobacterium sp. N1718 TaxID=2986822 RepID=UPI0022256EE1|nr:hypothetical protein [Flavobacterium sp. N1718]
MQPDTTDFNHEQKVNEGFSGEQLPSNFDPSGKPLQPETETTRDGEHNTVHRQRERNERPQKSSASPSQPGAGVAKENEDFNRDPAADRYPPSHPEKPYRQNRTLKRVLFSHFARKMYFYDAF